MAAGLLCATVAPVALSGTAHAQGTCTVSGSTTTCTFAFTGAEQTFTVPAGVSTVDVTAIGAAGGLEGVNNTPGGRGAQVSGTLTGLSAGQTLYVEVGGVPTLDSQACYIHSPCLGGFNGGGTSRFGGGGGGASDIRTQPRSTALTTTDSRLVVAAGGGGAGEVFSSSCTPGSQGGDAGEDGQNGACSGGGGGRVGTATGGGDGGTATGGTDGMPGGLGDGGNGGAATGGGGAGGYYGGGGGAGLDVQTTPFGSGGGGGGGSSLVPAGGSGPTVTSSAASVTISYNTGKPVSTTLTALPPRTSVGLPVVLSDLVCPAAGSTTRPTGTVTFTDTTTGKTLGTAPLFLSLGNCKAAGQVTVFRSTGTHTISAVYSGDSVYQGDSGKPETTTVTVTG